MRVAATTLILLCGVGIVGSNSLLLSPILPEVAADLASSPVRVSWAISAYGGGTALSALLLAPMIDRYGLRQALLFASAILTLGMTATALAPGVSTLILAQTIAGVGAGVILPAIYTAATRLGEVHQSPLLGRVLTGWSLSLVLGIPAGAFLTEAFGWRSSYALLAVLGLLVAAGFQALPTPTHQGPAIVRKAQLAAIQLPGVATFLITQFLFMTSFYGTYALFGDHVRQAFDLGPSITGTVIMLYGLGFGLSTLADRKLASHSEGAVTVISLVAVATVYGAMAFAMITVWSVFLMSFIWGFVNHGALTLIVGGLSRLSKHLRGTVLGLNSAVSYLGALVGPLVGSALYVAWGFTGLSAGAAVLTATAAGLIVLSSLSSNITEASAKDCDR